MKVSIPWLVAGVTTALAFLASIWLYPGLPAEIPIHWNVQGEADNFGSKTWAAWLMPGAMLALLGVLAILPRISPRKFEVTAFRSTYDWIVMLVTGLLGFLHILSLLGAGQQRFETGRGLFAGLYLFFALFGNVMGRVQRNFWVGIRVPWTLSSERVWNDTHRIAAWLWVAAGLIGVVLALLGMGPWGLVGVLVAVVVPIVYSYLRYKQLEAVEQV
jgi:uncharacterized membrane protein